MELSAALMFFYAIEAITSPLVASGLIETFGPDALFMLISAGHVVLVIFGLTRMRVRDTVESRTPYVYAPRNSFTIGRLLRRQRDDKM